MNRYETNAGPADADDARADSSDAPDSLDAGPTMPQPASTAGPAPIADGVRRAGAAPTFGTSGLASGSSTAYSPATLPPIPGGTASAPEAYAASDPYTAPNPYIPASRYPTPAEFGDACAAGYPRRQTMRPPLDMPWYGIGFPAAVDRFWRKALVFRGRASRGEYWWSWLFRMLLMAAVVTFVAGVSQCLGLPVGVDDSPAAVAALIVQLILLLPSLSTSVRRLHDANLRGWWVLIPSLLQVGAVVMLVGSLIVGGVMAALADAESGATTAGGSAGETFAVQTVVVAMLVFLGMELLSALVSLVLMVLPPNPRGARFDRPRRRTAWRPTRRPGRRLASVGGAGRTMASYDSDESDDSDEGTGAR
ncbi:DUF805 domain-containing protein [Bifidobacterium samirii]|uniref:DUF805 domain-containing protein n=1 Tax=Bifidobacterium samirii TaxID=2306974 RepID=A0A430FR35_9BIFI|nr:DUF805 domain-containing protein [Bifidobacterium samirii]RSX55297.1 hypothetical protein D2E24_1432 [Bifidobacterium samirii]